MNTILEETKFIMNKYHIKANKSLGQNFLIKEEVVEKIVTIPTWLNEKAEKKQINLSKALQEVLLYKVTHEK